MKRILSAVALVVMLAGCPAKTPTPAVDAGVDVAPPVTLVAPVAAPAASPVACQPDAGVVGPVAPSK